MTFYYTYLFLRDIIWNHKDDFFVILLPYNIQKIYSSFQPLSFGQNQNSLFFEESVRMLLEGARIAPEGRRLRP